MAPRIGPPSSEAQRKEQLLEERDEIYRDPTVRSGRFTPAQIKRVNEIDATLQEIDKRLRKAEQDRRWGNLADRATQGAKATGAAAALGQRAAAAVSWAPARLVDGGPAADTNALRELFGLEAFFDAGVLNPRLDPLTEEPVGGWDVAPKFADARFGPSKPLRSGRGASPQSADPLDRMDGLTVSQLTRFYLSLTPDELKRVQTELMAAGLYEQKPRLGYRDIATGNAMLNLLDRWSDREAESLPDLLADLKRSHASTLDAKTREIAGMDAPGSSDAKTETITITDAETLGDQVDMVAKELLGDVLDPERKAALVARLQDQERTKLTSDAQADFRNTAASKSKDPATAGASAELDQFINALIGQESGGRPDAVNDRTGASGLGQIMPEYWAPWALEAGLNPGDYSPANQRAVIRYKVAQMYNTWGNWRDVAVAWYSGSPASAWSAATLARGQGPNGDEPSMDRYADELLGRMGQQTAEGLQNGGLTIEERTTLPDAKARIAGELKAMDPNRYLGTQYYKHARNFFSLLRSPVG